jgi:hypothetical protein
MPLLPKSIIVIGAIVLPVAVLTVADIVSIGGVVMVGIVATRNFQ